MTKTAIELGRRANGKQWGNVPPYDWESYGHGNGEDAMPASEKEGKKRGKVIDPLSRQQAVRQKSQS